eukprot:gb/GECH01009308.1/.p1 GENE.gb/GECH01009308.1/~~gb/GECH01009308.1/.p1  ORF type:complete len:228 (+),score=46.31 gb/GECH01009308.1/:1-684(+)
METKHTNTTFNTNAPASRPPVSAHEKHPLDESFSFWFFSKPTGPLKMEDYESHLKPIGTFKTVEGFWETYSHLLRPSDLAGVSGIEFHCFKEGIKPVWEDPTNKDGGRWMIRLKKGVADKYWEDLLLALIGGYLPSSVTGLVISIRDHDILSVWTKDANDQKNNDLVLEQTKKALDLPHSTMVDYKPHSSKKFKKHNSDTEESGGSTPSTPTQDVTDKDENSELNSK